MAVPGGALSRADLGSGDTDNVREFLTDVIYNVSPTHTPLHTNIGREAVTNDLFDHLIDSLAPARDDNAHVDGDDFIAEGQAGQVGNGDIGVALSAATRVRNVTQISRMDLVVTRRSNIVNKAGRDSEMDYQLALKGKELMNDCELAALTPNAGIQTTETVAGRTAGLPLWLTSNTYTASAAAEDTPTGHNDGVLTNGIPAIPANGFDADATGAMTQTLLNDTTTSIYNNGGNPEIMMMSPEAKRQFSSFMFTAGQANGARIAIQEQSQPINPGTGVSVIGAVDVYKDDFYTLAVVPNRFQRSRDIFILETGMWAIAYLDEYHVKDIATTGDSEKKMIIVDWGLKSRNEAASGAIFDVAAATPWTA